MPNTNKTGRTGSDLAAEKPVLVIFLIILIFLFVSIPIWQGKHVKVFGLEFNEPAPPPPTGRDTVYLPPPAIPPANSDPIPKLVIPKNPVRRTTVRSGDTIVDVSGQPANINTGTNQGIIGNNNQIQVFDQKEVALTEEQKKELVQMVNQNLRRLPRTSLPCIIVISSLGDPRSGKMRDLIESYLKSEGYRLEVGGAALFSKPLDNIGIGIVDNCVRISVGNI